MPDIDPIPPIRERVDMDTTDRLAREANNLIMRIDHELLRGLDTDDGHYIVIVDNHRPDGPSRVVAVKTSETAAALGAALLWEGARVYRRLGTGNDYWQVLVPVSAQHEFTEPREPNLKPSTIDEFNTAQDQRDHNGENRS